MKEFGLFDLPFTGYGSTGLTLCDTMVRDFYDSVLGDENLRPR
jgi:truncated hemoglobin YjbI